MSALSLLAPAFGAGVALGWGATARVRRRAQRDGLTGLLRREAWEQRARRALRRATVAGLLDVDDFKGINDRHGHLVGDAVLCAIGERLTHQLDPAALVGRFGGDEFVLLARLDEGRLQARLDGLAAVLAGPVPIGGGEELAVGVSLGVARLRDLPARRRGGRADAKVLLREAVTHADVAMYAAKHGPAAWRLYDPRTDPTRPARDVPAAPRRRYRDHGPAALEPRPGAGGQD